MGSLQQLAKAKLREIETLRREHRREHGVRESRRNLGVHGSRPKGSEHVNTMQKTWGERDWLTFFEERAAICEFDGGLTRDKAEQLAAQCQGYSNVVAFKAAQKKINQE